MRLTAILCAGLLGCLWSSTAQCATRTTLNGQIQSLANQVKKILKEDPRVQNQPLQLAHFTGKGVAASSNFGTRIEKLLREELGEVVKEDAKYALTGGYHFVDSDDPTQKGAKILLITARLENDRGREIVTIDAEVNDSDDIFQILGLTGSAPHNAKATFQERNASARKALSQPTFDIVDKTRVAAPGLPQWSVGILKRAELRSAPVAMAPENVHGLAFIPIEITEYYEIELVNNDKADTVATVSIDGLDAANSFSADKDRDGNLIHWPGYFIPAGGRFVIRGWLHTLDPDAKDNVFAFRVAELGHGAATALAAHGPIGVITVQFREAVPPGAKLSGRSFGETAKGEGLQEKMTPRTVVIGENVLSTVSVRYHRPE